MLLLCTELNTTFLCNECSENKTKNYILQFTYYANIRSINFHFLVNAKMHRKASCSHKRQSKSYSTKQNRKTHAEMIATNYSVYTKL